MLLKPAHESEVTKDIINQEQDKTQDIKNGKNAVVVKPSKGFLFYRFRPSPCFILSNTISLTLTLDPKIWVRLKVRRKRVLPPLSLLAARRSTSDTKVWYLHTHTPTHTPTHIIPRPKKSALKPRYRAVRLPLKPSSWDISPGYTSNSRRK